MDKGRDDVDDPMTDESLDGASGRICAPLCCCRGETEER